MLDYFIMVLIAVANQEEQKTQETKKYLRTVYEAYLIKKGHKMVNQHKDRILPLKSAAKKGR